VLNATRDIQAGEELLADYGDKYEFAPVPDMRRSMLSVSSNSPRAYCDLVNSAVPVAGLFPDDSAELKRLADLNDVTEKCDNLFWWLPYAAQETLRDAAKHVHSVESQDLELPARFFGVLSAFPEASPWHELCRFWLGAPKILTHDQVLAADVEVFTHTRTHTHTHAHTRTHTRMGPSCRNCAR
jgi:hypothetical protein